MSAEKLLAPNMLLEMEIQQTSQEIQFCFCFFLHSKQILLWKSRHWEASIHTPVIFVYTSTVCFFFLWLPSSTGISASMCSELGMAVHPVNTVLSLCWYFLNLFLHQRFVQSFVKCWENFVPFLVYNTTSAGSSLLIARSPLQSSHCSCLLNKGSQYSQTWLSVSIPMLVVVFVVTVVVLMLSTCLQITLPQWFTIWNNDCFLQTVIHKIQMSTKHNK